jgi:hypothetical protein
MFLPVAYEMYRGDGPTRARTGAVTPTAWWKS